MDFLGLFVQSINQFASARLIVHGAPEQRTSLTCANFR